ncbi:MAG: dapD [Parcubacteria group bacterium]|nr:dapD [Parcubacteria group bacterium]
MTYDRKAAQEAIVEAWSVRESISETTRGGFYETVKDTIEQLDTGQLRVAELDEMGTWHTNQWTKQAILLYFKMRGMRLMQGDPPAPYYDKVPLKWDRWDSDDFKNAGFRVVPGAIARKGAFIDRGVVLMPSFVNIGAYVGEGTMVDAWATIGSCAQIGKNCHISGGAGIGGVLEPFQANPVIIEDGCFIGARSEVAEGVIVREGSVLSMGVFLGASTPIFNRETKQWSTGEIPPYSVVVPGNRPGMQSGTVSEPSTYCAVIMKQVDEKTRSKTSINELLRD